MDARLAVAVVDETIRAERVRLFDVEVLHRLIRDVPKPVIAAVNGAVITGGSRPPRLCDITIAAETATFGQRNPRRRSFDAGSGSAYLARILGEKRAREVWYLSVGTTQRL